MNSAWLVDAVTIKKCLDEKDYKKHEYGEPVKLDRVRVAVSKQYNGMENRMNEINRNGLGKLACWENALVRYFLYRGDPKI